MRQVHDKMAGTNAKKRPNYFKINIDAQKAFDSMSRDKIVQMLLDKQVNSSLVNAIRLTLENT
jgi:hypothetical protein